MIIKRTLRYLKGTLSHGIPVLKASLLLLNTFSDVDWESNRDDQRSTSNFYLFLGLNPMFWFANK